MKLTNSKIKEIIKEELEKLMEADPAIAAALMGKAGLGPRNEPTRSMRKARRANADIGDEPPRKEDVIKASDILKMIPKTQKDKLTLYNIATLLRNRPDATPRDIQKAVMDAREEADYMGIDEPLEENREPVLSRKQINDRITDYLVFVHSAALNVPEDTNDIKAVITNMMDELIKRYGRKKAD